MRIAVIGAGIGGLVAAVGLQRDGHEVAVFERRAEPAALGAGLTLFGNAFAALAEIGLDERVRAAAGTLPAGLPSGLRRADGRWLARLPAGAADGVRSIHRSDLHRLLLDALEEGTVRHARAAVSPDGAPRVLLSPAERGAATDPGAGETPPHAAHPAASATVAADLVVAADGVRSRARGALGLDTGVRRAGYAAWRGVTDAPVPIEGAGEIWGRGRRFGIVPLADGRVYWFASAGDADGPDAPDTVAPGSAAPGSDASGTDAPAACFAGWPADVGRCIAATAPRAVLHHDIVALAHPLPAFCRGSVVLIGDAAHAMTPDLGQGACQAVEDAVTLVLLLRGAAGTVGLVEALARYDRMRRPATARLARRARMLGRIGQLRAPAATGARDAVVALLPDRLFARLSARGPAWRPPAAGGAAAAAY